MTMSKPLQETLDAMAKNAQVVLDEILNEISGDDDDNNN
jgi:hypothetical protein